MGQRNQSRAKAQAIGICVGADETFYGLPILVAIELASGFIFTEVSEPHLRHLVGAGE